MTFISDGEHMWDEGIYHAAVADALSDFEDLRNQGAIEVDEDFWFDDEENFND